MKFHSFCPRCGTEFTQTHFASGTTICSCGWFDESVEEQATKKIEGTTIKAMVGFSVLFVLGFVHLGSWGNHAFSIPFVKAAEVTGLLSSDGLKDLAKTCTDLNKWECAETAYQEMAQDRGNVEGLAMAANLDAKINKPQQAIAFYQAYEKAGGKNAMSLLAFAKLLEGASQDQEAQRVYEKSIAANPSTLPVQATSGIVHLMMKYGQYAQAYERILAFHESAENASGYLNTEADQLRKQLGDKAIAELEKKHSSKSVAAN